LPRVKVSHRRSLHQRRLPVRVLSRLFRRRFLEELQWAHRCGELQFFGEHATLVDAANFAQWLAPLRQCEWVVYAKRPESAALHSGANQQGLVI